jgi:hypothetical protein
LNACNTSSEQDCDTIKPDVDENQIKVERIKKIYRILKEFDEGRDLIKVMFERKISKSKCFSQREIECQKIINLIFVCQFKLLVNILTIL